MVLSGLANGPHHIELSGKRDSGFYQDDPIFASDALVTTSRTWGVNTSYVPPAIPSVRINEILAQNSTTLTNAGATPDLIELYNYGTSSVDLSGLGLTDNSSLPYKFTFTNGTPLLGPGQYLILYADSATGVGIHLGFSVKASGDDVYLHDKAANGGALLDSVVFGVQIPDLSIGRGTDSAWVLCKPTFGTSNIPVATGNPHGLRINEWLADELFMANKDFVELFNSNSLPAALDGCFLSNAEGALALNRIPALSFIAANGYVAFTADGDVTQGADHLNFKLDPDIGIIVLSDPSLNPIDIINYGPQRPEACGTASTPPPSASSRSTTWNARATAPTASFSNRQTTRAVHHDAREGNPRRRPPRRVKHHQRPTHPTGRMSVAERPLPRTLAALPAHSAHRDRWTPRSTGRR